MLLARAARTALVLLAAALLIPVAAAEETYPAVDPERPHTVFLPVASGPAAAAAPPPPAPPPPGPGTGPVSGLPWDPRATRSGDGTFYAATGEGNCMFDADPGRMVAAMNHTDYANSLICGAVIEVTGPRGTVTVRIVDQCPECAPGDVDLSAEAFARIAEPVQGRVRITWRMLSPATAGPIRYRFKEGSSQWWTAVQIRNHRNLIWKVEYRNASGAWVNMPRQSYNYFLAASGVGPGAVTLRVTDIFGNTLTDSGLTVGSGNEVPGTDQFPAAQ